MNASHTSHHFHGALMRRASRTLHPGRAPLEPASARRFALALACLGVSYALAWIELPLAYAAPTPADGMQGVSSTLAAALSARVLIGVLYALVALRYAWARWVAVALCFASVALVAPLLPLEWRAFQLGALVTGLGLASKLAAAVLLTLPLRLRRDMRP